MRLLALLLVVAMPLLAFGNTPFSLQDQAFLIRANPLLRGLAGYWRLEEATSGIRYDSSKNGYHLISSNGVTQATGKVLYGAGFVTASSRWLYNDTTPELTPGSSDFTISCWVKFSSVSGLVGLAGKWEGAANRGYMLYRNAANIQFNVSTNGSTAFAVVNTNVLVTGTWYHVVAWRAGTSTFTQTDGGTIFTNVQAGANPLFASTAIFSLGSQSGVNFLGGDLDEVGFWRRALTANERAQLYRAGVGTTFPRFQSWVNSEAFSISTPAAFQVFQRSGSTADIPVAGVMGGVGSHNIEARFNGGAWQQITTGTTPGAFTGTLTGQAEGRGAFEVRLQDDTTANRSVSSVGIGDVFVIAGQSNASGRGSNNQSYSGSAGASLFGNNYTWANLADPHDSNSGQVDAVSSDSLAAGSVWPLLATSFIADQGVPVAFIPCALGGTSITAWLPSGTSTNRSSLYGSMVWRSKYAVSGGVKAVLWWQGETDALASMSQATYYGHFTNFTANVFADLGVKIMPCKLQTCSGIPDVDEARINAAIGQAWASDSNTLTGPDLTGLTSDDSFHLQTNVKLQDAADLWWTAIDAALYP